MQVGRKGQRASERKAGGGVLPGRPRREKQRKPQRVLKRDLKNGALPGGVKSHILPRG